MDYTSVDTYLEGLSESGAYIVMADSDKQKAVNTAIELLKDDFDESVLTDRAVALQVLYTIEGEIEGFNRLKRHGVQTYNVKGVSVTLSSGEVAPRVVELLFDGLKKKPKKLRIGHLI